jgi:hypothetical protein
MVEVYIEKDIPVSPPKRGYRNGATAMLRQMDPGDSVVVQSKKVAALRVLAKKAGLRVVTRVIGGGEVRIWRVS